MSLAWVSLNAVWMRLVYPDSIIIPKPDGGLLNLATTASNINNLTNLTHLQASPITTLTHILAPTSKATRFRTTVEHLSSMAVSMVLPLLVLRRLDNMAATTSISSKDTAKVLHPATVKDNHLDITREVVIEVNQNEI
jgi:hypothetical protein